MPKISLVMPVYKSEPFLSKAIESLLDQDFHDWELIVVMDGYSRKATEIIRSFKDERIKELTIEHGGACKARNEGAKISQGEYLAFFSSDFQAVPGMLRTWMRTFEDNPDADFIYGGYKFPDGRAFPSEPFDARQLETYNFIDGGFPLKRQLWEKYPWDEKIKSLNDWDFWLRIVKAGHKGYFMPNYYSYIAEYPRPGGLSHDSAQHWLERVKAVRENNGVPNRKIVVSSFGGVFFAKNVAKLLDADFIQTPSFKPHEYKLIYLLGYYLSSAPQHSAVFQNAPKDCKKVIHWLGTDILQLLSQLPWLKLKKLVEALNSTMTVMFTESEAKQKELAEVGLKTEVLPVLRDISSFHPKPFPKEFAVGIYFPGINTANYHPVLMENIIKNMPDVKFYLYGERGVKEQTRKNMIITGWKDINEIIDKCSVLLRYTLHDGLPTAPMEFLMSNRYVITNADMPHVEHIEGNEDKEGVRKLIVEKIRDLKKRIKKGEQPDPKIGEYYKEYLNPDKIRKRINEIIGA